MITDEILFNGCIVGSGITHFFIIIELHYECILMKKVPRCRRKLSCKYSRRKRGDLFF